MQLQGPPATMVVATRLVAALCCLSVCLAALLYERAAALGTATRLGVRMPAAVLL